MRTISLTLILSWALYHTVSFALFCCTKTLDFCPLVLILIPILNIMTNLVHLVIQSKKRKSYSLAHEYEQVATQTEASPRRKERADRILDAASELILRWGYKKTTMEDIARQAGVAKGTIYLHWKTRDELFLALLLREKVREGKRVEQEMANDPEGIMLHTMAKYSALAAARNPLLKAVILQDMDVLGDLIYTYRDQIGVKPALEAFTQMFDYLRGQGLIRSDMSTAAQIYAYEATVTGFLVIDQLLPEEFHVPHEEKIELLAETVRRTFELRQPTLEEQQKTREDLEYTLDIVQQQAQKE